MDDKKRILAAVALSHAFNDGGIVIIPILFPILKNLFHLSYTQVGIITGGGLLITLLTQQFIGQISDKKNRRNLLIVGALLLGITFLLLPHAEGFLTLVLFVYIHRFAASFFHPIGIPWIAKVFKKERVDWAMGLQSALGDFGAFLAILTTPLLVELYTWQFPFYIWAIISIFCLLIVIYLTMSLKLEGNNTNKIDIPKKPLLSSLRDDWMLIKKTAVFLPAYIVSGLAWSIIINYLPLLLDERTSLSLNIIGLMLSVWIGVGVIICLLYRRITTRFGRRNVLITAYILIGLLGVALSIVTTVLPLLIILIFLGVGTFLTYPALFSFTSEITDETNEGRTFAYIFTVELAGGAIILFLSGVTADWWGIWTPFTILGLLSLMATAGLLRNAKKISANNM